MHADGKSTLASVSKWNSGKVNCILVFGESRQILSRLVIISLSLVKVNKGNVLVQLISKIVATFNIDFASRDSNGIHQMHSSCVTVILYAKQ